MSNFGQDIKNFKIRFGNAKSNPCSKGENFGEIFLDDIKSKLNPSQYEAVTTVDGAVLVIAGAGSGKTRAIEYRVAHLVEKGIDPKSILLLTFTRKAAHEMLSRASRHDPRCKDVEGGTFHSFAFKVLKKYAHILGLSGSFSILDEADASEAVHRCGSKLDFFDKERKPQKKIRSVLLSACP